MVVGYLSCLLLLLSGSQRISGSVPRARTLLFSPAESTAVQTASHGGWNRQVGIVWTVVCTDYYYYYSVDLLIVCSDCHWKVWMVLYKYIWVHTDNPVIHFSVCMVTTWIFVCPYVACILNVPIFIGWQLIVVSFSTSTEVLWHWAHVKCRRKKKMVQASNYRIY